MAKIQLSDHFTYGRLVRFVAPTMGMMAILSIYSLVDGFFVSNFVGKVALAGVNLAWPLISMLGVFGMMIGAGGSALVGKLLGQGEEERANQVFSMLIWFDLALGIVLGIVCLVCIEPLCAALGAEGELLSEAKMYGSILAGGVPCMALQTAFQSFLVTAERPNMGLVVIVTAGVANIALDALFIIVFGWGIAGAAIATLIGEVFGGAVPFVFFLVNKTARLRLRRPPRLELGVVRQTAFNGLSELLSNISMSLVSMLYNYQLLRYIGSDGVAAFGVTMDVSFVFMAFFMGYCSGSLPLISFNFGAKNHEESSNLFRKSLVVIVALGICLTALAGVLAPVLAYVFVSYDEGLMALTVHALHLYKWAFMVMGVNLFASSLFTALNNGLVSAAISGMRTLVLESVAVLLLPLVLGANGIWLAMPAAEFTALFVSIGCVVGFRKVYGYNNPDIDPGVNVSMDGERKSAMELTDVLRRRKSVRSYTGEAPTEGEMEAILQAAMAAPVAMARFDSMHLTVITDPELLSAIDAAGAAALGKPSAHPLYGAPVLVLVSAIIPEGVENPMFSSAAMIVHNMALAATELGLGSCDIWGAIRGVNAAPDVLARLELPEGFTACCAVVLGRTEEELPLRDVPADKMAVSKI